MIGFPFLSHAEQNAIAVYAYDAMESFYNEALLPYFVAIYAAEIVGIMALKITK